MTTTEEAAYSRRWWVLLVLCLSLVIITLDNTILNVALPTLQDQLHATNSQLQWMVDSYTLVFAGLLLSAGSLGDRFGRKGALQLGLAIFALGSLASSLATTPDMLIFTRALMGIGGAFIMPGTLSILTNVFPDEERARAIGVWAGVSALGIAIGPLLGGFLIEHFSWHAIFTVNIPIAAIAIVAGIFIVPKSKDPSAPRLDPIGALLSIIGLFSLVYALIEAPTEGWGDTKILAGFGIAVVALAAFAWWELHTDEPMLDVNFFKNPRFTAASSSIALVFFAMFGFSFLLTQYFQFVLGYSAQATGVRLLPLALTLMIVAPLSARVVERLGTKVVVATGLGLVSVALALCAGLEVHSPYWQVFWRMVMLAVGMGCVMAPATESVMGSLPLAKAGVGSAVNDTTRQVGGALGVAIVGSVLSSIYGSKIVDALAGHNVPAEAVAGAKGSLGGALELATQTHQPALAQLAKASFVDGMHTASFVAAGAAAIGVVVSLLFLPARARARDVQLQHAEYEAELEEATHHAEELEPRVLMTAANAVEAPVPTRGRPRDPVLDDEIMAAAVHLIAEHGVEGLTMDAVARRAGVAKASIYRRFASKVDLLAAASAAVCPTALEAPDTGSVREDLVELLGAIVESFRAKSTNKLMPTVLAASSTNPEVSEALQKFSNSRRTRLVEVVCRGIDRGELDEHLDQELLGDQLVGVVLYRFLVTGRPLSKPVVERLVDQVLAGVSPR